MKSVFQFKLKRWLASALAIALCFCVGLTGCSEYDVVNWLNWESLGVWLDMIQSPTTVDGELEVHFIDVENADCIFVRQGDKTMLIDAGERVNVERIYEYLDDYGVEKLDVVIATHPHADHIGGMQKIIETYSIDLFLMSYMTEENTPTTATYLNMLESLYEYDVPVEEAVAGAEYSFGEATIQILAPLEDADEANNASIVARLVFGDTAFLFTGDAETKVEKQLLESGYDLSADVLKVGHHGSKSSTSMQFLRSVDPEIAVITCGLDNSYGHPHQEVMNRLGELAVETYRADECGNILIVSDGSNLSVEFKGSDR